MIGARVTVTVEGHATRFLAFNVGWYTQCLVGISSFFALPLHHHFLLWPSFSSTATYSSFPLQPTYHLLCIEPVERGPSYRPIVPSPSVPSPWMGHSLCPQQRDSRPVHYIRRPAYASSALHHQCGRQFRRHPLRRGLQAASDWISGRLSA